MNCPTFRNSLRYLPLPLAGHHMRTIRASPATLNFVPLSHTSLLPTKLRQPTQRRNTLGWGRYHISTKGRHFLSLAVGLRSRCFIEICNYIFGNMWLAYRTYVVNRVKANGLHTSNFKLSKSTQAKQENVG